MIWRPAPICQSTLWSAMPTLGRGRRRLWTGAAIDSTIAGRPRAKPMIRQGLRPLRAAKRMANYPQETWAPALFMRRGQGMGS
jgi:hypothetical protein